MLADAIEGGASEIELRKLLRKHRVQSLSWDAMEKAAKGITDISEINQMSWVELNEDLSEHEVEAS